MDRVLIDTDVFLDVFLDRKPFVNYSAAILDLCDRKKIQAFSTSVIISNVFYVGSKELKRQSVVDMLNEILIFIEIIDITKKVILQSLNSNIRDFEDALQNYAAIDNGKITTIITRNVKDYKHSQLAVKTPEEYF